MDLHSVRLRSQQHFIVQHLWLPKAPVPLPRLLPERRIQPLVFVRFLSCVICGKGKSCRPRAVWAAGISPWGESRTCARTPPWAAQEGHSTAEHSCRQGWSHPLTMPEGWTFSILCLQFWTLILFCASSVLRSARQSWGQGLDCPAVCVSSFVDHSSPSRMQSYSPAICFRRAFPSLCHYDLLSCLWIWAYEINIAFITSETKLLVLVLHEELWPDFKPLRGLRLWLEVAGYFLFWNFLHFWGTGSTGWACRVLHMFFTQPERCRYFCQCRHSQDGNCQGSALQSWHLSPTTFSGALGKESRMLLSDFISSAGWRWGKASVE